MSLKNNVMVFPGQGSQRLGMMADFADAYPIVKQTFDEASNVCGEDLWRISQEGPQELLDQTVITQPLMLAADIATWRIWQQLELPNPRAIAGHSLGEYSACVCANVIDYHTACELVFKRASLMTKVAEQTPGATAVIVGADQAQVAEWCLQVNSSMESVSLANINSAAQFVISGATEAVKRALELAKSSGVRIAKKLPLSVPVHCDMMKPAAQLLKEALDKQKFYKPAYPIYFNADAKTYADPIEIKQKLYEQLYKPVQWRLIMDALVALKPQSFIECGPTGVLSGLFKREHRGIDINIINLSSIDALPQEA